MVEKSSRPHQQGVGACHGFAVPPTNIPGGDPAGPPVLSRSAPSPDRPPGGMLSPTASGSGPPLGFQHVGGFKRALAPAPQGQRTARSGGRFACKSFDATATAQRAECLLRSTTRGPVRSKAICARHAEGVASGHSFWGLCGAVAGEWALQAHKSPFWRLGVRNYPPHPLRAL